MKQQHTPSPCPPPDEKAVFATYADVESYLDGLGLFTIQPGLDRMEQALARLELVRPPYTVVQVVGTNGKGSTSTMLAALAAKHGLRCGLHTSPHFYTLRERIRINGEMVSEAEWIACAEIVFRHQEDKLSYFEFVTCLAVTAFKRAGVDMAVMESGLGGSFDATTAMEADMVLFTPVSLDHQGVLGKTLREIAADKAGAVRKNAPVLSAIQHPEVQEALRDAARTQNATLRFIDRDPLPARRDGAPLALLLPGEHQLANARLALQSWRTLLDAGLVPDKISAETPKEPLEAAALEEAWLPGRMQFCPALITEDAPPAEPPKTASSPLHDEQHGHHHDHPHVEPGPPVGRLHFPLASLAEPPSFIPCRFGWPPMLLDGAHNIHGLSALGHTLAKSGIGPAAVIFSCLLDKEPEQLIPHLRALATGPVFVPPVQDNPRAAPPETIARLIGLNAVPTASLQEALILAAEHMAARHPEAFRGGSPANPLLLCGSLYLLGEFYAMRPDCLEAPRGV